MADDSYVEAERWKVTGTLGDGPGWGYAPLGDEVLVVLRGTVASSRDTLEDGDVVRTHTLKVTAAAKVGPRSTLASSVRKLLNDDAGTLL